VETTECSTSTVPNGRSCLVAVWPSLPVPPAAPLQHPRSSTPKPKRPRKKTSCYLAATPVVTLSSGGHTAPRKNLGGGKWSSLSLHSRPVVFISIPFQPVRFHVLAAARPTLIIKSSSLQTPPPPKSSPQSVQSAFPLPSAIYSSSHHAVPSRFASVARSQSRTQQATGPPACY